MKFRVFGDGKDLGLYGATDADEACLMAERDRAGKENVEEYKAEPVRPTDKDAAEVLAVEFSKTIREWLPLPELALTIARNHEEQDKRICHSHDFCDANMAMDSAWREVFGDPPDPSGEGWQDVWNRAWEKAKAADFKLK